MEMVQRNLKSKPERMQSHCEPTANKSSRSAARIALGYAAGLSLLVGDFTAHGPPSG